MGSTRRLGRDAISPRAFLVTIGEGGKFVLSRRDKEILSKCKSCPFGGVK